MIRDIFENDAIYLLNSRTSHVIVWYYLIAFSFGDLLGPPGNQSQTLHHHRRLSTLVFFNLFSGVDRTYTYRIWRFILRCCLCLRPIRPCRSLIMPFFRFYAKSDYFSNIIVIWLRRFSLPDPEVFCKVAARDVRLFSVQLELSVTYNRDPSKSRVPGTVMSPKNSMLTVAC